MLLEQSQHALVHAAIGRSCFLLDDERFDEWLAMCTQDVSYSIRTYSPEIRREMTWLKHDRAGLEQMLSTMHLNECFQSLPELHAIEATRRMLRAPRTEPMACVVGVPGVEPPRRAFSG